MMGDHHGESIGTLCRRRRRRPVWFLWPGLPSECSNRILGQKTKVPWIGRPFRGDQEEDGNFNKATTFY